VDWERLAAQKGAKVDDSMTNEELRAGRRERARCWITAGHELKGYPALSAEDETEATLAAAPAERSEKKANGQIAAA
jgi:hypothetical protein